MRFEEDPTGAPPGVAGTGEGQPESQHVQQPSHRPGRADTAKFNVTSEWATSRDTGKLSGHHAGPHLKVTAKKREG